MLNFFRTSVLLAALTAIFMAVGYFVGGQSGMLIAFVVAALTNLFGYWNADKLVLRMQNAHEMPAPWARSSWVRLPASSACGPS